MPFSFLNTALLAGLAAAVLPILIHLFSRRKVARVPFSSLRFLEEIAHRRVRRVRLTQWIILALRVLAVALVALALGRPAFRGDFAFGRSKGESAVAVVLDRSFSMQAEGARGTLWTKAKERGLEVLDALEPGDRVILLGVDPHQENEAPYPDPAVARDVLRSWKAGYGTTDLAAAIRRAAAALADATALNKELFVVSDFQRSGLGAGTDVASADLTAELDPGTRTFLIPVDEGPLPNTALEEAILGGNAVNRRVFVQVAHHAGTGVEDLPLTVEAGSEVLGEARLSLDPGQRTTLEVPLIRLPAEGERLHARLARDRLPADDVRYIPAAGIGRVNTLLVQDPAQPSPYLPIALRPEAESGRFEVRRVSPEALVSADLAAVRLVILDNVTTIPRQAIMRLRPWREAGGALFLVLGDRVDLRYYNEALLPALFDGVTVENMLGSDEPGAAAYRLVPRVAGSEVFAGFDAKAGRPVTGADFWRIVRVKTGPQVRVLAEFGPALPALVQGERALLFASSLDGRWNNFPTHSAFLPLLYQGLNAILREGDTDRVTVGQPVQGTVDRALVPAGAELACLGPNGIVLNVAAKAVPRGLLLRSDPAPEPGFYAVRAGGRTLFMRAVNVDPAESDLTPLAREELRRVFPGDKVTVVEEDEPLGAPIREARYGREFWRELILLALLLLVVEGWLSRRGAA